MGENNQSNNSKFQILLPGTKFEFLLSSMYSDNLKEYYKICRLLSLEDIGDIDSLDYNKLHLNTDKFIKLSKSEVNNKRGEINLLDNLLNTFDYISCALPHEEDNKFIGLCNFITSFTKPDEILYDYYDRIRFIEIMEGDTDNSRYSCKNASIGLYEIALLAGDDPDMSNTFPDETTEVKRLSNKIRLRHQVISKAIVISIGDEIVYMTIYKGKQYKSDRLFYGYSMNNNCKASQIPISKLLKQNDYLALSADSTQYDKYTKINGIKIPYENRIQPKRKTINHIIREAAKDQLFNIGDVVSNYEESYIIYCPSGEDFIVVEDYGNINEQFYNESIEIKDVIHIDDLSELEKLAMHERLNYKYMCMEDTFVTYLNLLKRKLSFNDYSTINEKLISACRNFSLSSDGFDALEKAGLIQKTCINKDELEWSAERRSQSDLWTVELSSLRNESGPRFEKKYLRGEDSKEYILFDSRVESLIVEDTCGAAKLVYRSGMYFDKLKSLISVIKNSTEEKFSVFNDFGKNFEDSDRLIQLGKYACSYYTDSIGVLICLDIITCNFFIVEVTDYKDNQYTFEVLFVFSNFTEATSFFNGYVICLANVCHFEDMEYETGYRSKQLSLSQEQKTCKEKLKDGYVIGRNKLGVDLG